VTRRLRFRAEAFADVAEAFSWYQERRPGLGWEFDADLDAILALLRQVPEAGPVVHRHVRRALLHRFPYSIYYYTLIPDLLEVRAVVHMHRDPGHWRRRA